MARLTILAAGWALAVPASFGRAAETTATPTPPATGYNFAPEAANRPLGVARGIHPGRVVWARDPAAARWSGNWKQSSGYWWSDESTDQARVDALLSATLRKLTSASSDEEAWQALFRHHNERRRQPAGRGYQAGERVAVKINCNNSSNPAKPNNFSDASPQVVLAMVRQLVQKAHVPPADVLVYDARRSVYNAVLAKVWAEFKDVRFVQEKPPAESQPKPPGSAGLAGLEAADWVQAVSYSRGDYKEARLIPRQVRESTYLVNLALLKAHSYPYEYMGRTGDEGQTGVTMCGKNHFGSIKGTSELHFAINTNKGGTSRAYSPMVDLAAAPDLGAKTVLYVLDALYGGRKHQSYPLHFPHPPFGNRVEPYENPDWPASVLASQDGVALDSVGIDILYSQSRNNDDPQNGNRPRIMLRDNSDDYLHEMALADRPPSGTAYKQEGRSVASLGVHEHWDGDATRRYSRNKDRRHGRGIELVYLPLADAPLPAPVIARVGGRVSISCASAGARIHYTTDGTAPTDASPLYTRPFKAPAQADIKAVAVADTLADSAIAIAAAGE